MKVARHLLALGSGLLFAFGLGLGGMTQPTKIVGFLDVGGDWDPSLALVMAGGIVVLFVAHRVARRMGRPLLAPAFPVLARSGIDARLVGGAALFGVGWALAGFCPGPALVSLGGGVHQTLFFVPAMLSGMAIVRLLDARRRAPVADETGAPAPSAV